MRPLQNLGTEIAFSGQMLLSEMATRKNITNFSGEKVHPQF